MRVVLFVVWLVMRKAGWSRIQAGVVLVSCQARKADLGLSDNLISPTFDLWLACSAGWLPFVPINVTSTELATFAPHSQTPSLSAVSKSPITSNSLPSVSLRLPEFYITAESAKRRQPPRLADAILRAFSRLGRTDNEIWLQC